MKILQHAIRQYRHNTDNEPGFVIAYDAKETDKVVAGLQKSIKEYKALIDRAIEWYDKMPELILVNLLREHYPALKQLIEDIRKAREGGDE